MRSMASGWSSGRLSTDLKDEALLHALHSLGRPSEAYGGGKVAVTPILLLPYRSGSQPSSMLTNGVQHNPEAHHV